MPNLTAFSKIKITSDALSANLKFVKPLISNRNRLEGLPRSAEFDRSLRAEIADPLWMLTRQWQMGEFDGEDAGTAYQAKILSENQMPDTIRLSDEVFMHYDVNEKPLEVQIENENIKPDFYLRIQMGRQFFKILAETGLQSYENLFLQKYPLAVNINPQDKEAVYLSHAVTGFYPDGFKILEEINNGDYSTFISNEPGFNAADLNVLEKNITTDFLKWFENLYHQPGGTASAWLPQRMEYNFALELPRVEDGKRVYLEADQYSSGKLDWQSFDENTRVPFGDLMDPGPAQDEVQAFIPTPLQYAGMPNPRFWQMEDSRTDFGKIQTGTSGLLSLLVAEYGLTYSNDWFILPYQMKINTLCEVKGIMVTDVFGQNILIEPSFKDPELNWHEFSTFRHTERQNRLSPRNRFYLAPSLLKLQQSEPLEKINFMRDEMTNMVWAIENTVPSDAGGGREVKLNRPRYDQNFVPADPETKIRYLLGTNVPENWIPFIPVHKPNDDREIRLQRARIPNAPLPISVMLNEEQPVHFIEEEEVQRAGVIVKRTYKRTRWLNGKTCLWVGRSKTTGRGEGWSGLMFDQIL